MKRLGIAISVHSKIDALATTVNVIRDAWEEKDVYISVCCNSREHIDAVTALRVDCVMEGAYDIPTTPKPYLRSRQFDCIRSSVMGCFCEARYAMHIHADACALDSEHVMRVIERMESDGLKMAFRGRGLDTGNLKTPDGDVDDHFLFFDCNETEAREFFECDPLPLLTHHNVENLLAKRMRAVFTPNEWWHYSDMGSNVVDKSAVGVYPDGINHRNMNPFNYDPDRKLLHAATLDLARPFIEAAGLGSCIVKGVKQPTDAVDDWLGS